MIGSLKAQYIQILLSILICSAQAFLVSRFTNPFRTFTDKHSTMIDAYTTSYVSSNQKRKASDEKNASIYFERVQIGESFSVLNKPVLLFLPGLDGRGDYSSNVSHTSQSIPYSLLLLLRTKFGKEFHVSILYFTYYFFFISNMHNFISSIFKILPRSIYSMCIEYFCEFHRSI